MSKIITNAIVDRKLLENNREIKRLGSYVNSLSKIDWLCLNNECNNIWLSTPNNVLNSGRGCPKCGGNSKLSNEIVDDRLEFCQIKRIGNYINNRSKIDFQCLGCDLIWQAIPSDIFIGKGCPRCAGCLKLTNEIIDDKIINCNLPIKRLDNCAGSNTNIRWQCLKCDHIWKTKPAHIFNSESGCAQCNIPGQNEKLMHSILKNNNIDYELQFCIKNIDINAPPYRFDAFIPKFQLAIEYNGRQHYMPTGFGNSDPQRAFDKQQSRDIYIRNFCISNKIKLVEIDGRNVYGITLIEYMVNLISYLKNEEGI